MNRKLTGAWFFSILLVAAGLMAAACAGAKNIPAETVLNSLFAAGKPEELPLDMQLVRNIRLPRALASAIIGGLLGMGGAMMQGVTRNPIAEPSIMGITQGAALAVAIVSVNTSLYGLLGNFAAAMLGAFISGILVLLFSLKSASNMNISRLILAGTALGTFFLSLASVIALLGNRSQELAFWVSGGFRTASWDQMNILLIVSIPCLISALIISSKINIVSLGDDVCTGLGVNPVKIRILTMILLIPMCAVSVAIAGNIAFVGLIVPHVVRKMSGNDYRKLIPLSFLFGSALLIWADIAARMVQPPYETPIGLFTALIGVPVFLLMIRKESR
ncbi:FecCD family ABC transporter permease [Robinsoniella peoriensis]|uniref:Iron-uptake system permease protein FeuB n=1 Tax=Robinsoniella peoriensis TaxID=180332 RepID=A0A4U8Q2N0_9FIRM|nr:iron ABC transporter permease [Robinsoniella peoriensis]MDU7028873.1 iron ABC transporter permease [Clostridiales bacterium]TLC98970.1 Iron-uptake system permease protein FeuB [Robinsoniella peoriensis]